MFCHCKMFTAHFISVEFAQYRFGVPESGPELGPGFGPGPLAAVSLPWEPSPSSALSAVLSGEACGVGGSSGFCRTKTSLALAAACFFRAQLFLVLAGLSPVIRQSGSFAAPPWLTMTRGSKGTGGACGSFTGSSPSRSSNPGSSTMGSRAGGSSSSYPSSSSSSAWGGDAGGSSKTTWLCLHS